MGPRALRDAGGGTAARGAVRFRQKQRQTIPHKTGNAEKPRLSRRSRVKIGQKHGYNEANAVISKRWLLLQRL